MPGPEALLAGLGLVGQGGGSLADPSLNEALSPAAGLIVSPYYFQSAEQEGRWKHQLWGFSQGRNLVPPEFDMPPDGGTPNASYPKNPASTVYAGLKNWKNYSDTERGQACADPFILTRRAPILRVTIGALQDSPTLLGKAIGVLQYSSVLGVALTQTITQPGSFTVGATWLASQTEILAGHAGLFYATGFNSTYGHRAKVEIGGVSLGNYIPTAQLIGLSGYINPVGPVFIEFRCAVVVASGPVSGGNDVIPVYGFWWARDSAPGVTERKMSLDPDFKNCWAINLSDPLSPPQ
jgi:hypothetical protein